MAVTIKNLASGTLTAGAGQSITKGPPSGKSWLIKGIILTNKDAAARTLDLKVTGTSPSTVAYIAPPSMTIPASGTAILDNEITLQNPAGGAQETLSVAAVAAPSVGVDYVLNGIERDL